MLSTHEKQQCIFSTMYLDRAQEIWNQWRNSGMHGARGVVQCVLEGGNLSQQEDSETLEEPKDEKTDARLLRGRGGWGW